MRPVAALYVEEAGPYANLPNVDAWGESRDARRYRGPHPIVAHPPCKRWGRYWGGGPSAKTPRILGDDGGCFAQALWAVRTFGGVIEHPEASHAWRWFGLQKPPHTGGWVRADEFGGWTCCVAQGHYGHVSQKLTWLYAAWVRLPDLVWGRAPGLVRFDEGFHSAGERSSARAAGVPPRRRLTRAERLHTPQLFQQVLLQIARTSQPRGS